MSKHKVTSAAIGKICTAISIGSDMEYPHQCCHYIRDMSLYHVGHTF